MTDWRRPSAFVINLDTQIRWPLLALGRLDVRLHHTNIELKYLRVHLSAATDEQMDLLHEAVGQAYFWVLGAYEIVRTLEQRFREREKNRPQPKPNPFTSTKEALERIRIPVAKHEPARRHKQTDYSYAYAALSERGGIGWKVSPDTYIAFEELSDMVLKAVLCVSSDGT
jgi:hypothetical protein